MNPRSQVLPEKLAFLKFTWNIVTEEAIRKTWSLPKRRCALFWNFFRCCVGGGHGVGCLGQTLVQNPATMMALLEKKALPIVKTKIYKFIFVRCEDIQNERESISKVKKERTENRGSKAATGTKVGGYQSHCTTSLLLDIRTRTLCVAF